LLDSKCDFRIMPQMNLSTDLKEKELFLEFQRGNQVSFDYFFDKYYQGLCVYALKMINSKSESEDLVQDFFVRLLENRKSILINGNIKSYFLRSIHNRCLDKIAHEKVILIHEKFRLSSMAEEDFQEYPLLEIELKHKIDRAIENLPDGIRETFILNRFDGLSYREIATKENISVKTVEYRISKALCILRRDLGDYLLLILFISKL